MYPEHVYVTFGGTLGNSGEGVEKWSCGIRLMTSRNLQLDSPPTREEVLEYLTTIAEPQVRAWWAKANNGVSGYAYLKWVKANAIGPDGKYVHDETNEIRVPNSPAAGGTALSIPKYPLQTSMVVTLETGKNTRFARKGRVYLPAPSLALISTAGFDGTATQTAGTQFAALVKGLTDTTALEANDVEYVPSVVSKSSVDGSNGTAHPIVSVSIDNRPDVQRSRAAQLVGARFQVPLPA